MSAAPDPLRRAYWLKTLHHWHWVSAALCLLGMLLFSVTGFTLNHAADIEASPQLRTLEAELPTPLHESLKRQAARVDGKSDAELPPSLDGWLRQHFDIEARGRLAEWSADEIYLSLPEPGGDAWVRVDLTTGQAEFEHTRRGWIAYLNDLHKGRNTGAAWRWFIDAFALASLVFALTGLFILKLHAANRPGTWPVLGFGIALPLLLAILFIH